LTIGTTSIALGASSLTLAGLTSVSVTGNPTSALELAPKQYVDALVSSGIHFHAPVRVESPTSLTATYNNGSSGVGATLTNAGTQVALAIDGVTLSLNDRVLIYTQTDPVENGIYYVSNVGSGSTNWVLTRATDADSYEIASPNGLSEGSSVYVQQGATGAGELYTCNTTGTIVFGTTAITFVQISSAQIYSAGTGLTLTNTEFSLTVPVLPTNGGTGITGYAVGDLLFANTTTTLDRLTIGSSSRILTSNGTAPSWTDPSGITVGSATTATTAGSATTATTATNIAAGLANEILYQSAPGTTAFIPAPTIASTYLGWNGSAFAWGSVSASSATNLSGGSTGSVVYQSSTGVTAYLNLGTATYLLRAGASAPEYVDPATVSVGSAATATTATTATNATNVAITTSTANSAYKIPFANTTVSTTGNYDLLQDSTATFTYNPSTNTLTVDTVSGDLNGNATTATTATNATNVATTATSTNANFFVPFVAASTTGNQALGVDAGLSYNPSTNALTAGIAGGTF
jgi:hypothetical protein